MTDKERVSAVTQNDSGYSLTFYRTPDSAVWVTFSLAQSNTDILASNKWPMYRVDKRAPRDLDDDRRLQNMVRDYRKRVVVEPKWVNFMVWDGNPEKGRSEELIEFMDGESVVFRYTLFTGGYAETRFSLLGAGPTIAEALGLAVGLKSGSLQRTEAFHSAIKASRKACEANAVKVDFSVCFAKVKACADKSNGDADELLKCTTS